MHFWCVSLEGVSVLGLMSVDISLKWCVSLWMILIVCRLVKGVCQIKGWCRIFDVIVIKCDRFSCFIKKSILLWVKRVREICIIVSYASCEVLFWFIKARVWILMFVFCKYQFSCAHQKFHVITVYLCSYRSF